MIKIPIIETTEWSNNTNFNQILIGISEEEWKMMSHYESVSTSTLSPLSQSEVRTFKEQTRIEKEEAVLRYAADELCRLIKHETVPMRYVRMHINEFFFDIKKKMETNRNDEIYVKFLMGIYSLI